MEKNKLNEHVVALIGAILTIAVTVGCLFAVGCAAVLISEGSLYALVTYSFLAVLTWIVAERL